ncbi:MAG: M67 family metallopeptidase [Bacteroidota bacterium]
MNSTIVLNQASVQTIEAHALATFPDECCGFLYGVDSELRLITQAIRVDNSKEGDQRRRFEIAPLDYLKAEQYALDNELQLLGIYHSHPNHPAIASEHDLAKAMPFFSYVIVSVMDGVVADLKSWKLKEAVHQFAEEEVLAQKADTI